MSKSVLCLLLLFVVLLLKFKLKDKGNLDKYRILILGTKLDNNINIVMDDIAVISTDCLELLGVSIDRNLRFDEHISKIYKKGSQRVGVLMRLRNLIPLVLSYNYLRLLFFPI